MMRSTLIRTALATAVLAALGGCADSTAPEIDDALLADMALVAADATLEDLALMTATFGFGGPAAAPGMPGMPGGGHGIGGPLSGTRSVTFYDAAGVEQDAYDAITTASIHYVMELAGSVERETWSASMERTRDETVTGLAGEETTRTFNGFGSESMSRSRHLDDGVERAYAMEGEFTKTDVVVPVPGSDPRWPLSGTIHRTMTVTVTNGSDGSGTRTVDVTITFDGDQTATGIINGETFEIDLAARRGQNPVRHFRGR